jgi:hypothetical protein
MLGKDSKTLDNTNHGNKKPEKEIKKIISRSRKRCHDQENSIKTKRTSQRYDPKNAGNYQNKYHYHTVRKKKQDGRQRSYETRYHENITVRYPEK